MTELSPAMLAARRLLSGSLPARVSVRFSGDTVRPSLPPAGVSKGRVSLQCLCTRRPLGL